MQITIALSYRCFGMSSECQTQLGLRSGNRRRIIAFDILISLLRYVRTNTPACLIELQASCSMSEADSFKDDLNGIRKDTFACMSLLDRYL